MANEFTLLGTPLASTTNANSYATASHSPAIGRGLLAAVLLTRGGSADPVIPSLSGNGLTWTLVEDPLDATQGEIVFVASGTLRYRLFLFEALTGASPSAGALTVDCGGVTHTGCAVIIAQSDVLVDLVNFVRQVKKASATASSISVTLAAFDDAAHYTVSCFGVNESTTFTHEGTELGDVTYSTPVATLMAQFLAGEDTSPGASYGAGPDELGALAVEVGLAAVGGSTVSPSSIARTRAFGSHTVTPGAITISAPSIVRTRAFGSLRLDLGVAPPSIVRSRAFGGLSVSVGPASLLPGSIARTREFGTALVQGEGAIVSPSSVVHVRAFGNHTLSVGEVVISPPSVLHARAFTVNHVVGEPFVEPQGAASHSPGAPGRGFREQSKVRPS